MAHARADQKVCLSALQKALLLVHLTASPLAPQKVLLLVGQMGRNLG